MQAGWKQRRRDARQARAALKQSGQHPDLRSECTGAQSMSTSRPQASGKAQQNGSMQRLEQEAQSARVRSRCLLCFSSIRRHAKGGETPNTCRLTCAQGVRHRPGILQGDPKVAVLSADSWRPGEWWAELDCSDRQWRPTHRFCSRSWRWRESQRSQLGWRHRRGACTQYCAGRWRK